MAQSENKGRSKIFLGVKTVIFRIHQNLSQRIDLSCVIPSFRS